MLRTFIVRSISDRNGSNHTQSVAYLIGETAAEKLIKEYSLESANELRAVL